MTKSKSILVASRQIVGATEKTGRAVLEANGELTSEVQKALGLDKDDVAALVASGALIEQAVRLAGAGDTVDSATHARAVERADKAEQDLAAANGTITDLQTKLDAATAAKT